MSIDVFIRMDRKRKQYCLIIKRMFINYYNFQLFSIIFCISDNTKELDIFLNHNISERFECRWSTIKIDKSPSIMLSGMENSILGIWVAHGEGRFTFRNDEILQKLKKNHCLAIKYTDDFGNPTEKYPFNPNGSIGNISYELIYKNK